MNPAVAQGLLPLTAAQLERLTTLLEARLAGRQQQQATRQDGESLVEHAITERAQDGDEVMQRDGEREVDGALSARDASVIAQLAAALERIRAGRYGTCTDCQMTIRFARLLAEPEASRCAPCEAVHEAQVRMADTRPG